MTESKKNFSIFSTSCLLISRIILSAQLGIFWRPKPRWTTEFEGRKQEGAFFAPTGKAGGFIAIRFRSVRLLPYWSLDGIAVATASVIQHAIKSLLSVGDLVSASLRSLLNKRHWRLATLAAFAKCSCRHGTWLIARGNKNVWMKIRAITIFTHTFSTG